MRQLKLTKTVKRTYTSKRTGKTITKIYTYSKTQLRSRKTYVINSKGKINKSAIKRLVDKGVGTEMEIRAKIHEQLGLGKTSISEARLEASILHNRIEGMFANAGMNPELAAAEIGSDLDALYDSANWAGDKFTDPASGRVWQFEFSYTGSVWSEVRSDE